ncbi:MAG: response regulator [Rhodospirillales bacterium]|jgi:CheY-like chemotaxis protein|nr:response regulator [Rhodospirillales bacterium]MDP6774176.1 response regulator [Rhodospirillales bacterium]|tara:strand:- start:21 stop:431 length:411 start_codon:yes stop_codon:yes gene_type:complete
MAAVDMSKLHVLVVEDQIYVRNIIKEALTVRNTGKISAVANGYEALATLQNAERKVDVILLDLVMPRLNGYDFIKKLRNELPPSLSGTPVIVISGLRDKEALDKVKKLGIDLFLLKPITADHLVTRISAAMRRQLE